MKLLYGTTWVDEDEPCLALYEMHLQSPGSRGFHRYQIIHVMRHGKPAEFREDMGLAKNFKGVDQLRIPGGVEEGGRYYVVETVGRLRDIADYLRTFPQFDKKDFEALDEFHDNGKKILFS